MGGLFSPPAPTPPPAPPVPPPMPDIQAAQDRIRKQDALANPAPKGAVANELTGPDGDLNAPNTATKTLLGQ